MRVHIFASYGTKVEILSLKDSKNVTFLSHDLHIVYMYKCMNHDLKIACNIKGLGCKTIRRARPFTFVFLPTCLVFVYSNRIANRIVKYRNNESFQK